MWCLHFNGQVKKVQSQVDLRENVGQHFAGGYRYGYLGMFGLDKKSPEKNLLQKSDKLKSTVEYVTMSDHMSMSDHYPE